MRITRRLSLVVALGLAGVTLTGCGPSTVSGATPTETAVAPSATASSTPDPAKPEIGELTLTTEGMGELQFGSPPPSDNPAVNLVTFHSDACAAQGLPGIWTANYPDINEGSAPQAPFAVQVTDDAVTRIDVNSTDIYTDTGIHIGSSLDEVLGVYSGGPDAVINHADVSDVYVIKGTKGQLQFEVAVDRIPGYWATAALDTVVYLSAIDIDSDPFGVAATDNTIGVCNIG